jgi:hypothetical protein
LGFWDACEQGTLVDYDTVTESSLMRWGNWDAVTYTANGNHASKIPAQLCYENTAQDSGGFLTAFDATVCY